MADINLIGGERTMPGARRAAGAPQQTKHINDTLDPLAIEAKALSACPSSEDEAPRRQGPHRLHLVEEQDAAGEPAAGDTTPKEAAAAPTAVTPAKDRPPRSEFVINPLSRRVVPYWRRKR